MPGFRVYNQDLEVLSVDEILVKLSADPDQGPCGPELHPGIHRYCNFILNHQ